MIPSVSPYWKMYLMRRLLELAGMCLDVGTTMPLHIDSDTRDFLGTCKRVSLTGSGLVDRVAPNRLCCDGVTLP